MVLQTTNKEEKPLLVINGTFEIVEKQCKDSNSSDSFPSDISETELMEMLTEVMSIMLLNKEKADEEFASSIAHYDPDAKLPEIDFIKSKLGRETRKRAVKGQRKQKSVGLDELKCTEDKSYSMNINPYFYSLFKDKQLKK